MSKYKGRYIFLGVFTALLFVILIVQLANLQIRNGDIYAEEASGKKTKTFSSRGDRGTITDVNSMTLAYDEKIYNVQFYRDTSWDPGVDADGNQISANQRYTESLLETIEIVERYGGTINSSFSLVYNESTGLWEFNWGNVSDSVKEAREAMWRSNFYVSSYDQQELFSRLCSTYKIPDTLTLEEKIQVLGIWETMQMNAFLGEPIIIAADVSWETVIEIETRALTLDGISIGVSTKRVYPNNTLASHVLGYVGKIQSNEQYTTSLRDKGYSLNDLIGLDGVEKTMEDWLTPNLTERQGKRIVEVDRYGTVSRELSSTEPRNGNNVKLTIDSGLQRVAEAALEETIEQIREAQEKAMRDPGWLDNNKEELQGTDRDFDTDPIDLAEKGAIVVIDMEGRVLALASYPPYDPNAFIAGGDAAVDILLDPRNPLLNYAIGSRDTPGSIFKMVTSTAALATGLLEPYEQISDMGYFTKYDDTNPPKCWVNINAISRHANQTIVEGLNHSCNYFFYELSSRLYEAGNDDLYRYAALYGLTSLTGIELPGELRSYVGSQTTLYDPQKAIGASEQATWRPYLVANQIKNHLNNIAEERGMSFDQAKLETAVKSLMDMAVAQPQGTWVRNIRTILMEELDMSRELVYLQAVVGDIYLALNEIKWGGSEAIMCGVGQSITSVTPVAVARYVAAIANNGTVYDLTLIDSITSPEGEVLSESQPVVAAELTEAKPYLTLLRQGMKGVVDDGGTASSYFSKFEYLDEIAVKTGTAEKTKIDLENNGWMVGFAPYENPEIAVVVYIPNGYGGARVSPAMIEIMQYYLDQRDITVNETMPASNWLAY